MRFTGGYCKRIIDNCFLNEGYYLIRGRETGSTVKITDDNGNIIMEKDVNYEGIIVYAKTNYVIELNDANADRIYLNE